MKQLVDLKVRNNMLKQELEVSPQEAHLVPSLFAVWKSCGTLIVHSRGGCQSTP